MWTTAITIPNNDTITQDSAGFPTHVKDYAEDIPASIKDTTRNDEILANRFGYTADVVVEIDAAAYNGRAGYFIDQATGIEYDIKRTYRGEKSNTIQLTGQRRDHGRT